MSFIREFSDYMKTRTDCPPEWHINAAVACLAVALGNRVWTDGWVRPIYPNLWLVNIGPSGFGKSGPLDMAQSIIHKAGLGEYILPNSFSQEALVGTVEQQPVGVFFHQEFARFLEVLGRDYNHGAMETLTEWYDVPEEDVRILQGRRITIRRPTITILGASSPDWFAEKYKQSMLRGGFLARFLFCPSSTAGDYVDDPGPRNEAVETSLAGHLVQAHDLEGKADFSKVRRKFSEWDREQRLRLRDSISPDFAGMRSRAGALVKKAAILFRVSRDPYGLTIADKDLDNAIAYVTRSHDMAERYLTEEVAHDREEADRLRFLEVLKRQGGRAPRSTMLNLTHLSAKRLDAAAVTLAQAERIAIDKQGRSQWFILRSPNGAGPH